MRALLIFWLFVTTSLFVFAYSPLVVEVDGENSVENIEVTPGQPIEIHIKTSAGTGYEWEMAQAPVPHSATLLGDPTVTEANLPGGTVETIFQFVVSEDPNRGFTLFFQLRRPWENEPLRTLHVSFQVRPTTEESVLNCESSASRSAKITYRVSRVATNFMVRKFIGESEVANTMLASQEGITGYGGTYVFFHNQGKSGYLLIYYHHSEIGGAEVSKTLLDINLFHPDVSALNTAGPDTTFRCSTP